MKRLFMVFQMVAAVVLGAQDIINVGVRGISDANRDGVQKDRLEAIMDAKRQACEKAGISIESTTTVENFQMVYDLVESQAAAVLLPGFQIIDNGYGEDGTYSVVLIGQVTRRPPPPAATRPALPSSCGFTKPRMRWSSRTSCLTNSTNGC